METMPAPKTLLELVERFDVHRDRYRSLEYNETQVRREFIDPFFESLGWDIQNRKGFAEPWKEVVHEDSLKVGGVTKAPDYSFRLGGRRLFFLEAKKPAVNLKEDPSPAYQLRRYAWTAKLPVSILTDFEEFIVYDTRIKPVQSDKASTARVLYIPYTEYPRRWHDIAAVFSPEAIQKGAFDKYVESATKKRGTAEVDDAFLAEIEEWRGMLARNIALRNSGLTQRELNFAVQRTIDRIVFLRICEDRAIEQYGRLLALLGGTDVHARLRVLFERADERYNSGLFHFHKERARPGAPDTLTPGLVIDDKVLKSIIRRLYYPESPCEFSVLPAEIRGQVYERFLGSVIRLTAGGHAKVEQKPEVRKADGVYYTPTYIVDYIVKHTVGKLLEGKTPQEIAGLSKTWRPSKTGRPLTILDPACGSGSFLLGAYQCLLDWHLEYYAKDPEKWRAGKTPRIYQHHRGGWQLTTAERKRILIANIYGVDIDPQAVEVTKLSLLLKVLEGEDAETLERQYALFHQRALPDLASNIKCGNSLIGPDFYHGKQLDAFDEEETYRINAFDWNAEFKEIMSSGGFDAVIGNPPYVKEFTHRPPFEHLRVTRLRKYYQGKMDLWYAFACLSLDILRKGGYHSFIATSNWITNSGASILRKKISEDTVFVEFIDFGAYRVFANAGIQTMIYLLKKEEENHSQRTDYRRLGPKNISESELCDFLFKERCGDYATSFKADVDCRPTGEPFTFVCECDAKVLGKIQERGQYRLRSADVGTGIDVHQDFVTEKHVKIIGKANAKIGDGVFVLTDAERIALRLTKDENMILKPYFTTNELGRYWGSPKNSLWVIYTTSEVVTRINDYPNIKRHLERMAPIITSDNAPYGLHRARKEGFFLGEKIISLRKTPLPYFTYTDFPCYVSQTYFVLKPSDINLRYLVGLLNSRLCHFWLDRKGKKQGNALQIDKAPLPEIPIKAVDLEQSSDKAQHDKMVSLVERMLDLNKRLAAAKSDHERTVLRRQIESTNHEIDHLVYQLYELTDEEIAIVQG